MRWILPILLFLFTSAANAAWYDSNWPYRQKITINAGQVNGDQTDFPVYVNLADLDVTNIDTNGDSLRVTKSDGITEVAREVVFFDGVNGELHFLASGTLSGTSNSDFYLYYGNDGVGDYATSATYGAENVWSNYVAVWHNEEDPSGTAPQLLDSTSGSFDMTTGGTMTSGDNIAGKLAGNSVDYDGSDDYASVPDTDASLDLRGTSTIQYWFKTTATLHGRAMVSKAASAAGTIGWITGVSTNVVTTGVTLVGEDNGSVADIIIEPSNDIDDGSWYMYHAVRESTQAVLYLNGVSVGTDSTPGDAYGSDGSHPVDQASRNAGGGVHMQVTLDEVRLRGDDLTAAWIDTEYNNQNSPGTFYTVSAEESAPATTSGAFFFGAF